jgi:hypothetical protein
MGFQICCGGETRGPPKACECHPQAEKVHPLCFGRLGSFPLLPEGLTRDLGTRTYTGMGLPVGPAPEE